LEVSVLMEIVGLEFTPTAGSRRDAKAHFNKSVKNLFPQMPYSSDFKR
jgi:hypothetical protein